MEEHVARFLAELEGERGFSGNTVSAYGNDLRQFAAFLAGDMSLSSWAELTESQLTSYVLFLRERQYAKSTVARKVAAVKSFSGYLVTVGVLRSNPAQEISAPRVEKFVPKAITYDEMQRLLDEPCKYRTPEGIRDRAMLQMLYATGMRVSEMTGMDLEQVDLGSGEITCGSHADRQRCVELSDDALVALEEYIRIARPMLLHGREAQAVFLNHRGSRLTRQGFWLILKAYADGVGIGEITPHTLRHSYAVHQLRNGRDMRDVQRVMGHMSISTTQVYQQLVSANGHSGNGQDETLGSQQLERDTSKI